MTVTFETPVWATDVPKPIAEGLVKILEAVGTIEKKGHNRVQNYDFVREGDLSDKVRPAMIAAGLSLHQSVVFHDFAEQYTTKSGSTMFLTTLGVAFTWVHTSGAVYPVPGIIIDYGADTGDKGANKAMTACLKYFLMKTFLVSTGDDLEADEKVDEHGAAARAEHGSRRVTRGAQEGVQRGGKSDIATDAQRAELVRFAREMGITKADDLMALVQRIISDYGEEPPQWPNKEVFGAYLKGLDATRMGQLVIAAEKLAAADAEPTGSIHGGGGESGAPEPEEDTLELD